MKTALRIVLLLISIAYYQLINDAISAAESYQHPDVGLNTIQMIQRQGYPVEEHIDVRTPDGYLLDLHRIPSGKNKSAHPNRPVVFLMHGLLCSSTDWVNMGPKKSIAYQLADAGYDVWMGNARGNTWSRKHVSYDPDKDSEFWHFSWHEIGIYDLPTMIDYVLNATNQSKLFYIGHSQGTTSFFVMCSEKPEYNDKIRLMSALSPVAYMSKMTNPFFKLVSNFQDTLEWVYGSLGMNEFLPSTALQSLIRQMVCDDKSLVQEACANIFFLISGWNSEQLNRSMIPVIASNAPAGSSTRQLMHYGQEIRSGKFRQYDFGVFTNIRKYAALSPPRYNVENIRCPVALYYASNDWLAAEADVQKLADQLPNKVLQYLVPHPHFNHLDFLFAIDVKSLLYNKVLETMQKY